MRSIGLALFIFLFGVEYSLAQFDLFHFEQKLKSKDSMSLFLEQMLRSDQLNRGVKAKGSHDVMRLVSLSYYFNNHPFPSIKEESLVYKNVWIHCPFLELSRISFPIVHKLYKTDHITEKELRSYYLRSFFQELYYPSDEDLQLLDTDLSLLMREFNLPQEDTIDMQMLYAEVDRIKELRKIKRHTIDRWKSKDLEKEYDYNGKTITKIYQGHTHEIYKRAGNYYYDIFGPLDDPTREGEELIQLSTSKYKLIKKKNNITLEIDMNGDLVKCINGETHMHLKKSN